MTKNKDLKYFGPIFWIHLALIIPAYLSPFLVSWWLITAGIVILQIQYFLIGGTIYLNEN